MKRMIRATSEELVNVYAKTVSGDWELIFKDIPESQATAIWQAGFATGQNRFSIENEAGRRVTEHNRKFVETFTKEQSKRKGEGTT